MSETKPYTEAEVAALAEQYAAFGNVHEVRLIATIAARDRALAAAQAREMRMREALKGVMPVVSAFIEVSRDVGMLNAPNTKRVAAVALDALSEPADTSALREIVTSAVENALSRSPNGFSQSTVLQIVNAALGGKE